MRSAVIVALLVLITAGTARPAAAQPGLSQYPPPAMPQGDQVSEDAALWLSLGGTAASWTMLVVGGKLGQNDGGAAIATTGLFGILFAPSFGHWYAREVGTRGLGLRVLGTAALAFPLMVAVSCEDECGDSGVLQGLALLGVGLFVAGTIDDIATAPTAARRYNHRFDGLAIAPLIRRDAGGIVLSARF